MDMKTEDIVLDTNMYTPAYSVPNVDGLVKVLLNAEGPFMSKEDITLITTKLKPTTKQV